MLWETPVNPRQCTWIAATVDLAAAVYIRGKISLSSFLLCIFIQFEYLPCTCHHTYEQYTYIFDLDHAYPWLIPIGYRN